jgi:tetratricopeptide (TPR) repeat protein
MYLKGSKWSMNHRRKRPNWFRIILLSLLVAGGLYFNSFVLPNQAPLGVPTPTATRAAESYISEAEGLFKQGKLIQAIDVYKQAVISQADNPQIRIDLARVQVFAGQYDDAVVSAEEAILLNNNNSMAHAVHAWALDFQGDYLKAESAIKRAIEIDPNNGLAHAYYVEILVDSYTDGVGAFENIDKAIDQSQQAIALAPGTLETYRARGYILEATANYEEAIREYQAAIAINPNIADLHLALGRNYRVLGIYDKAVEEFTLAITLNPGDPTPYLMISRTYATVGEYAKAMQYAETAVTNNPIDTSLRGNLGVMYYRNALWPDAVKQLTLVVNGGFSDDGRQINAIQLIPDVRIAEYYFTYGLVLAHLNRCGEALPVAQTIQARVPADELAVANATEIINLCQKNLNASPEPLQTPTETGAVSETPVPTP